MAVFFQKKIDNGLIAVWEISESIENLLLKADLNANEYQVFNSIVNERRRLEFLCVRALLKEIMGSKISIYYEESGRPYIENEKFISITHAKNYVGIHLSDIKEVGIDLEIVSERVKRIQQRFLNAKELSSIDRSKEVESLILAWSAKECVFKMMPHSNIDFRDHISVNLPILGNEGIFLADFINNDEIYSIKLAYHFIKNFVMVYNI